MTLDAPSATPDLGSAVVWSYGANLPVPKETHPHQARPLNSVSVGFPALGEDWVVCSTEAEAREIMPTLADCFRRPKGVCSTNPKRRVLPWQHTPPHSRRKTTRPRLIRNITQSSWTTSRSAFCVRGTALAKNPKCTLIRLGRSHDDRWAHTNVLSRRAV